MVFSRHTVAGGERHAAAWGKIAILLDLRGPWGFAEAKTFFLHGLMIRHLADLSSLALAAFTQGLVRANRTEPPLPARARLRPPSEARIHTRLARVARAVLPFSGISSTAALGGLIAACRP